MKKVLFVFSSTEYYSGAEVVLSRLALHLKQDFSITGLFPNRGDLYKAWIRNGFPAMVIPFITAGRQSLSFPRVFKFLIVNCFFSIFAFFRILSRKIDVVHVNDIYNLHGILAARIAGKKVVCHVHAGVFPSHRAKLMVLRIAEFLAQKIVFVSKAVRKAWYENLGIPAKSVVIYNMCPDPEKFDPEKYVKDPDSPFMVGMIAKICREKGHHYFIEAAEMFKKAGYNNLKYSIVGGKMKGHEAYYRKIVGMIESGNLSNDFALHGMAEDVPRLLSEMDVFVHTPDFDDPFPTVVLEAMMMGKPVVCFDSGGISEQFENGVSGILVPSHDLERLVKEVIALYKNPARREAIGKQARVYAIKKFSPSNIAGEFASLYHNLLKA